jgi:hypothetical protein
VAIRPLVIGKREGKRKRKEKDLQRVDRNSAVVVEVEEIKEE